MTIEITKGDIWRHTASGQVYKILGFGLNTITDKYDVIYQPLYFSDIDFFTRQIMDHEKAFLSMNANKTPRFEKI